MIPLREYYSRVANSATGLQVLQSREYYYLDPFNVEILYSNRIKDLSVKIYLFSVDS